MQPDPPPSGSSPQQRRSIEEDEYTTDAFRMQYMKVLPCSKHYVHDWTECPFAHPQEKARRRDPSKHSYTGIACPSMKKEGRCGLGDHCPFSHNVFEYWLHPTRYRTQLCKDTSGCNRKICFFAHGINELRTPDSKPFVQAETVMAAAAAAAAAGGEDRMSLGSPMLAYATQQPAAAAAGAGGEQPSSQRSSLDILRMLQHHQAGQQQEAERSRRSSLSLPSGCLAYQGGEAMPHWHDGFFQCNGAEGSLQWQGSFQPASATAPGAGASFAQWQQQGGRGAGPMAGLPEADEEAIAAAEAAHEAMASALLQQPGRNLSEELAQMEGLLTSLLAQGGVGPQQSAEILRELLPPPSAEPLEEQHRRLRLQARLSQTEAFLVETRCHSDPLGYYLHPSEGVRASPMTGGPPQECRSSDSAAVSAAAVAAALRGLPGRPMARPRGVAAGAARTSLLQQQQQLLEGQGLEFMAPGVLGGALQDLQQQQGVHSMNDGRQQHQLQLQQQEQQLLQAQLDATAADRLLAWLGAAPAGDFGPDPPSYSERSSFDTARTSFDAMRRGSLDFTPRASLDARGYPLGATLAPAQLPLGYHQSIWDAQGLPPIGAHPMLPPATPLWQQQAALTALRTCRDLPLSPPAPAAGGADGRVNPYSSSLFAAAPAAPAGAGAQSVGGGFDAGSLAGCGQPAQLHPFRFSA